MKDIAIDTSFIIDSSAMINILFPDEMTDDKLTKVFRNFEKNQTMLYAPYLLQVEVTNSLKSAVLSKRATEKAEYIHVAHKLKLPLLTLDRRLSTLV
jgi:predicted nucleic acid-binding protein